MPACIAPADLRSRPSTFIAHRTAPLLRPPPAPTAAAPARFPPSTMASGSTSSNVVGVHYRVGKKIGEGSFGVIFEGTNLLNQQQVAIKFEPRKSDAPQLRDEYRTYKILVGCRKFSRCPYFTSCRPFEREKARSARWTLPWHTSTRACTRRNNAR